MKEIDIDLQSLVFDNVDFDSQRLSANAKQRIIDQRTDKVARVLALYPTTNTRRLARMFKMSYATIVKIAHDAGITKIERRGGHNRRKVEVLNAEGYIVGVYDSALETGRQLGLNGHSLHGKLFNGKCTRLSNGTFARYR